jgi:hypothetical protein
MRVVRLRRGFRIHLTDNEFEVLKHVLMRGLLDFEDPEIRATLPYKGSKVLNSKRWADPLAIDEDRRGAEHASEQG